MTDPAAEFRSLLLQARYQGPTPDPTPSWVRPPYRLAVGSQRPCSGSVCALLFLLILSSVVRGAGPHALAVGLLIDQICSDFMGAVPGNRLTRTRRRKSRAAAPGSGRSAATSRPDTRRWLPDRPWRPTQGRVIGAAPWPGIRSGRTAGGSCASPMRRARTAAAPRARQYLLAPLRGKLRARGRPILSGVRPIRPEDAGRGPVC